jgi:multiple sugar transport system ATP-binding protein
MAREADPARLANAANHNDPVSRIVLANLSKTFRFGAQSLVALSNVSLAVTKGELLTLVGPSGSGKTTLLRLVAGLETPDQGRITFDERDVTQVPPEYRGVAMVFQSHALFPHFTAAENLGFGLRLRGIRRSEIQQRVGEMAELLGIAACLGRRPAELSGGEKQRVALGRALIKRPQILLLDEPFGHLDQPRRVQLQRELPALRDRFGTTMLLVTHDPADALALGQRVAVLQEGRLQQIGTAQELRDRPAHPFVAEMFPPPR